MAFVAWHCKGYADCQKQFLPQRNQDRDETDFSFKFTVLYFRIFFPIKYMSLRETKWTAHIESRHWIKVGFETIRMQWSHLTQGLAN